MLLRCKKCQKLYAAQSEHDRGICLYCLQTDRQSTKKEQARSLEDWREPLYEYACRLAGRNQLKAWDRMEDVFIRLGDYKDCVQRLENARIRKQELYERIENDVQLGGRRGVMERAVEQLSGFTAIPGAQELLAAAEEKLRLICEKEEREKAEALRRREKQKKRRRLLGIVAASLLAGWALVYALVVFPGRLDRAEMLIAQEQYEEALALCMKSEQVKETERGGKLLRAAQTGTAHAMREQGRFEEAAEMFGMLDMQEVLEETYLLWSDALAVQGEVKEAIRVLLQAEKSEERWNRLSVLYMERADDAAHEAIANGTQNAKRARLLGQEIPALDAQLRYCHLLYEAGFDLAEVYPDGVAIEDAKLAMLQIDARNAQEAQLPLENALVFWREEDGSRCSDFPWLIYSGGSIGRDRSKDSMYSIRLMPGHMFREGASPVRSFAQADTVLLMDGVYIEKGKISVWTDTKLSYSVVLPKTRMSYPYFSAVSSVAAYDLHDPRRRQVFVVETAEAPCSDAAWISLHGEDYDKISGLSARMGKMNMEGMREALDGLLFSDGTDYAKGGGENGTEP